MNVLAGIRDWVVYRWRISREHPFARQPHILIDSAGFGVFQPLLGQSTPDRIVGWNEIEEIRLFQIDCYAIDQIRMQVFLDDDCVFGELTEDMSGWKALIETLPNVLPGCLTQGEWYPKVCRTAFDPNPTTIFSRKTQPSDDATVTRRD